jgi:hypothetical protein
MVDPKDVQALKTVRAEFSKRGIDISRADVRVMHGVCHIRGTLGKMPHATFNDLDEEVHHLVKVVRQHAGVRDVALEIVSMR